MYLWTQLIMSVEYKTRDKLTSPESLSAEINICNLSLAFWQRFRRAREKTSFITTTNTITVPLLSLLSLYQYNIVTFCAIVYFHKRILLWSAYLNHSQLQCGNCLARTRWRIHTYNGHRYKKIFQLANLQNTTYKNIVYVT